MSRSERRHVLTDFWTKNTHHELDVEDGDKQLKLKAAGAPNSDLTTVWLGTLKALYPQNQYSGDGDKFKLHPENGVTLKLNRCDGTLRIKGKKHLEWFKRNFDYIIEHSGQENAVVAELTKQINALLRLGEDELSVDSLLAHLPPHGAIKHGPTYIYRLWRGLLDRWLARPGVVYVVSPLVDARRMCDVLLLLIKHRLALNKVTFCTVPLCDGQENLHHVTKQAKKDIRALKGDAKQRLVAEERIKMALQRLDSRVGRFHCKFIAHIDADRAEILLTSANFHRWHFDFDNGDMVVKLDMTPGEFKRDYLDPLGLSASQAADNTSVTSYQVSNHSDETPSQTNAYEHVT